MGQAERLVMKRGKKLRERRRTWMNGYDAERSLGSVEKHSSRRSGRERAPNAVLTGFRIVRERQSRRRGREASQFTNLTK